MTAPLVITSGEPAGIGPDICLALAGAALPVPVVVLPEVVVLLLAVVVLPPPPQLASGSAEAPASSQRKVWRRSLPRLSMVLRSSARLWPWALSLCFIGGPV